MVDANTGKYQLYYVIGDGDPEPGPSFDTLDAALRAARKSARACDILGPDGHWYAKQQTVGMDLGGASDGSAERVARTADDAVAWMRTRPSRSSRGTPTSEPDDES